MLSSALQRGRALLRKSPDPSSQVDHSFTKAPEGALFPKVDPTVDGEDCDHDCESCTIKLPSKWKIDEDEKLYGRVNGWSTHMLVATGKTDWTRDVQDEKGSVMEAVRDCKVEPSNGKLMLSASNMALPPDHHSHTSGTDAPTTILLLPAFIFIDNITPATVSSLITDHISPASTTTTPLNLSSTAISLPPITPSPSPSPPSLQSTPSPVPSPFRTRPCPHKALILLCSQKTRDARCGQSAPLLRRELERHLRSLGLYRDLNDERPGGVGIYFISHVGGHKFAANMMIYRRGGVFGGEGGVEAKGVNGGKEGGDWEEGTQGIWLARVRPEDCEGIVKYTVLQGKVVKPEKQLRGGFDRRREVVSW